MWQILGILNYQRTFVPGYADLAQPLNSLLKKDLPFEWTSDCRHTLDQLINKVAANAHLAQPDPSKPYALEVDASAYAIRAILTQPNNWGKPLAIGYFSKALSPTQRNYDVHDCELMAVVESLEHWHHLLLLTQHEIQVYSDHANLQYYKLAQHINHRVARYHETLADYWFRLHHKPGALNKADPLSRHPDFAMGNNDNDDVTVLPPHQFANELRAQTLLERVLSGQFLQRAALEIAQSKHNLTHSPLRWTKMGRFIVVDDNNLRKGVISLFHNSPTAGHPGIAKTSQAISMDYWWPNMCKHVEQYVKGCATCQATKPQTTRPRIPLSPITPKLDALPFSTIALDC